MNKDDIREGDINEDDQGKPSDRKEHYEERMLELALRERGREVPDFGAAIVAAARSRQTAAGKVREGVGGGHAPVLEMTARESRSILTFKRAWVVAASLAGIVVLPSAANWAYRAWQRHDLQQSSVHLIVSAPA